MSLKEESARCWAEVLLDGEFSEENGAGKLGNAEIRERV